MRSSKRITLYGSDPLDPSSSKIHSYRCPGLTIQSDNVFETVCENCGGECSSCQYGESAVIPLECISLSKDGLDEHAKSYGGPLSEFMIDPGYWRTKINSTRVLECYHKEACQGGVTDTETFCTEGYKGPCEWVYLCLAKIRSMLTMLPLTL